MKRYFFCFSVHKSGHHAIMNWMRSHMSKAEWTTVGPKFYNSGYVQGASLNRKTKLLSSVTAKRLEQQSEEFSDIVINMEDQHPVLNLDSIDSVDTEKYGVIILRDPFNNISSAFKHQQNLKKGSQGNKNQGNRKRMSPKFCIKLWKEHAKEVLGETQFLSNKIVINFNSWFQSQEYRDEITAILRGKPDLRTLNHLTFQGKGSSFDRHDYQNKAQEMNVLNRWQRCPEIYNLFDDEVINLATKIFGSEFVTPIVNKIK